MCFTILPSAVPNVLVTGRKEVAIYWGQRPAEVVLSEQMFGHYPSSLDTALSSSRLESDR